MLENRCPKVLTQSRLKLFALCEKKHWFRFHELLDVEQRSLPLVFGSVIHKGLEVFWQHKGQVSASETAQAAMTALRKEIKDLGLVELYGGYEAALAEATLDAYMYQWGDDRYVAVAVEEKFLLPMPDAVFGGQYRDWQISGKLDVLVLDTETNDLYLMDHKTASPKTDLRSDSLYWLKLKTDWQITMYWMACNMLGYNIKGFIYDVLKRPFCKPELETPVDKRKYRKDGKLYSGQFEQSESTERFYLRILQAFDSGGHDNFFVRKIIHRKEQQLESFKTTLNEAADRIEKTDDPTFIIKNDGACLAYGVQCPYLGACIGGSISELKGVVEAQPFPELAEEADDKD